MVFYFLAIRDTIWEVMSFAFVFAVPLKAQSSSEGLENIY